MKVLLSAILILTTTFSNANEFEWKSVSLAYAKLYPHFNYSDYVTDYIQEFYPKKWKTLKNDEFLLDEKKVAYISEMKERVTDYNLDTDFTIRTSIKLGKYDFENNLFPLKEPLTKNSYFYVEPKNISFYQKNKMAFPYKFEAYLDNPEVIEGLHLAKEEAKNFIKKRKSSNGDINRKVLLELTVKLNKFKNSEGNQFIAKIQSYQIKTSK
jgi:hypothetical protein